jgi:hypothetical protein
MRKDKWIGDILGKKCLLKHKEKTEGTGRRGRRRKQLLDDIKETRRYWKLEGQHYISLSEELALEEALDLL